jgi:tetratricopeptide (TPR) repeat protein/tRNA A-37 threonylcarbamoyl transferase component Bud32
LEVAPVIVSDCPSREELAALVRGLLSGDALDRVAAHIDDCPACLAAAQEIWPGDARIAELCRDGGSAKPRPTALEQRYVTLRLHAAGGLGEVHVAHDTELGRQVALKRIRPARADDPDSRRRFLREAAVTARLEHPGVVPVYGLVSDPEGGPSYAMRLVAGQSLHQAIRAYHDAERLGRDLTERRLALRGLLTRFVAVCQTVAYAHSRGVVHRDLKPANVMLGPYGETLVVDWGLAKPISAPAAADEETTDPTAPDSDNTGTGLTVGTPAYMSPEQAAGRHAEIGPASDVYGLGATLYTILTGKPPFEGEEGAVLKASERMTPVPPRRANRSVPPPLEAVCLRAMAPRPQDRFASAADLGAEVERWLAGEPVQSYPERWPARAARWARRHRAAAAALVAGLLVAAVLGGGGSAWLAREAADRRSERTRLQLKDSEAVGRALAELPDLVRAWRFREAAGLLDQTTAGLSEFAPPEVRGRLEAALADVRLAERLDAVRLEKLENSAVVGWKVDTTIAAAAGYREAFKRYGLDCMSGEVAALGERIAMSPVREALLAGLDDWATGERNDRQRERLTRIARAADPHPWRDQFRDSVARRDQAAACQLAKQANVEQLTPTVLEALATALGDETSEGERLLRRAQIRHPADLWLNFRLGYAAMRKNDPASVAGGIGYYSACLAARETVVVYLNLADGLFRIGDPAGAEAACRRAVELDPTSAWAQAFLANIFYRRGDLSAAVFAYRRALELDPNLAWANVGLGDALTKQRDLAGAAAAYRRAVELAPQSDIPHLSLGIALHNLGDLPRAATALRRAIELDPKSAKAHARLGMVLEALGDLAGATTALNRVTELDPKNASAHSNLGIVLFRRGDTAGAVAACRRAVELDPKNATALVSLGGALYRLGDLAEALAVYRRAVELDPKNAIAHSNLGMALLKQGDFAGAAAACRRAIELDPKNARAHTNLGVALQRLGDLAGAAATLRRVTELDPKDATAHSNLANVLTERGDLEGAATAYRRAVELAPKDAHADLCLAYVLMQLGRFAEAKAPAQRALDLLPPGQPGREKAASQLERCELMLRLESKLPAVLRGEARPADAAEQIALAELAIVTRRYAAAARLYEDLLQKDPGAVDVVGDYRRYNAACAAARAACGPGMDDPAPDAAERARWRRQALGWLQADLKVHSARLAAADPMPKDEARRALRHWQSDPALAGVRDTAGLAALPADERDEWRRFWTDVAETLTAHRK